MAFDIEFKKFLVEENLEKKSFILDMIDIYTLNDVNFLVNRINRLYKNGLTKQQINQLLILSDSLKYLQQEYINEPTFRLKELKDLSSDSSI